MLRGAGVQESQFWESFSSEGENWQTLAQLAERDLATKVASIVELGRRPEKAQLGTPEL